MTVTVVSSFKQEENCTDHKRRDYQNKTGSKRITLGRLYLTEIQRKDTQTNVQAVNRIVHNMFPFQSSVQT